MRFYSFLGISFEAPNAIEIILWVYYIVSALHLVVSKSMNQSFYQLSLVTWIFLIVFKLIDIVITRINLKKQGNGTLRRIILIDILYNFFCIQRLVDKQLIAMTSYILFTLSQEAILWIQLSETIQLLSDSSATQQSYHLTNMSLIKQQPYLPFQTCKNTANHTSLSTFFSLPFYHSLYLFQLLLGFLLKSFYEYQYFCAFSNTFANIDFKQISYLLVNLTALQGLYFIIKDLHPDLLTLLILLKLLLIITSTLVIICWKLPFFGIDPQENLHSPFQGFVIAILSGAFLFQNVPVYLEQFLASRKYPDRWQVMQSTQVSKSLIIASQTIEIIVLIAISVIVSSPQSILISNLLVICQLSGLCAIFFAASHFFLKYKEFAHNDFQFCCKTTLSLNELLDILQNSKNLQYLDVKNNIIIKDSDMLAFSNEKSGIQKQKELLLLLLNHLPNPNFFIQIPSLVTTKDAVPPFIQITGNQLSLAQGFCEVLSDLTISWPYLLSLQGSLVNTVIKYQFAKALSDRIFTQGVDYEIDKFIKRQNKHFQVIGGQLKNFYLTNCAQIIAFDRSLMPPLTINPRELLFELVCLE